MTNSFAFAPTRMAPVGTQPNVMVVPLKRKTSRKSTVSKAAVKKIVKSKNRQIRKAKTNGENNTLLALAGGFVAAKIIGL